MANCMERIGVNFERWGEIAGRLAEAVESPEAVARAYRSGDSQLIKLLEWHRSAGDFLNGAPEQQHGAPANILIGRLIRGRYRLEGVLGRGGAGVVFRATDEQVPGRRVIVKLLHDFW